MRIGNMIISHLNKLWKAKFFTLCDVIFLVRLQEKFEIDHSWEWKGSLSLPSLERYCISAVVRIGQASRGWANLLMDTCLKSGQAKMSNLSKTYGTLMVSHQGIANRNNPLPACVLFSLKPILTTALHFSRRMLGEIYLDCHGVARPWKWR